MEESPRKNPKNFGKDEVWYLPWFLLFGVLSHQHQWMEELPRKNPEKCEWIMRKMKYLLGIMNGPRKFLNEEKAFATGFLARWMEELLRKNPVE
jgi:hypothetical protein